MRIYRLSANGDRIDDCTRFETVVCDQPRVAPLSLDFGK